MNGPDSAYGLCSFWLDPSVYKKGGRDKCIYNVQRYGCVVIVLVRCKEGLDLAGRVGCVDLGKLWHGRVW